MGTTMKSVGEQKVDELVAEVRQAREDHGVEFANESAAWRELKRRANDGEEEAIELFNELSAEEAALAKGAEIAEGANPEEPAEPEAEPASVEEAARAQGLSQEEYLKKLNELREEDEDHPPAQGLDEAALPTAADEAVAEAVARGDIEQLAFRGFEKQIGGKKPTASKVTLTGGAQPLEGRLTKGATYIFEVKARVGGVGYDDQVDSKTGQAVDCTVGHKARILGMVRVDGSTIERLEELQDAVRSYFAVPDEDVAGTVEAENRLRVLVGLPEAVPAE